MMNGQSFAYKLLVSIYLIVSKHLTDLKLQVLLISVVEDRERQCNVIWCRSCTSELHGSRIAKPTYSGMIEQLVSTYCVDFIVYAL